VPRNTLRRKANLLITGSLKKLAVFLKDHGRGTIVRARVSSLASNKSRKPAWIIVETGEDRIEVFHADVFGEYFPDDRAKVRR
jgi:hypothetical protein